MSRITDRSLQWSLMALLLAALAGCATGPKLVRTEVTSFNEWPTLPAEKTYAFSRTLEYQNSLELKSYEDMVRDELTLQGFKLAADPAQANLVVTLRPSVSGTSVEVRDPWPFDPFWGSYGGFYGPRRFGGFYGGPYWGGYGYGINDYSVEVFKRRLELDIDSRTMVGKRYYEGRVENSARSPSLPQVMPVLVRALFSDFPGNNGQTRRVDVPVQPVRVDKP
jgi:hypothetical protein